MSEKKKRVVVTYIEAGMGHIVTAQAIADALKEKYGEELDIIENYTLRDSGKPFMQRFERYLVSEVKKHYAWKGYSAFQMWCMYLLGSSKNTLKFIHQTVFHRETWATVREFEKLDPDMIVCTHFFVLYAAIVYRKKVKPSCKVVLYCPDNMIHGWWDNRVDKLYTNCDNATKDAIRFKFPQERILQAFFPTRKQVIEANESKAFYREKFGIPQDKFAVVIADGAYAKAMIKRVASELLKSDLPLTICVLAGRNEKLKAELDAIKDQVKPNITLLTFGFVKDAPQLYGACDLFVTKAGPNAMLDSVMMNTPLIIDYYASPIEKASKRLFVDEKKCGYYIDKPKKIREKIEFLIQNDEEMQKLREAVKFFDKSQNGAGQIADDIRKLL